MKPNYKHHKHYMKPNTQLNDALTRLNELRAKQPARPNVDEWLTQQAEEVPDLLKMYAYAATLAKHRYDSFLAAGFTELQSFELTKIYITL